MNIFPGFHLCRSSSLSVCKFVPESCCLQLGGSIPLSSCNFVPAIVVSRVDFFFGCLNVLF
ncbi:hypothetical protein Hanom_Chr11g01011161 [Helianthus anomalus]